MSNYDALVRDIQSRLHNIFLKKSDNNPGRIALKESAKIPWSWIAVNGAKLLSEYPTGLTDIVLLSILELMWEKTFIKRFKGFDRNFSTIQAVYDSTTSETFLLEVTTKSWELFQGSNNYQITVTDEANIREIDIFMHPKFSKWIHLPDFFRDRRIRLICPPKSNAPVVNRTNDLTLHRRYRVPLIPPTDLLMIMLNHNDKEFVKAQFYDRIRTNQAKSQDYKLWLKVIHVELVSHTAATTAANFNPDESTKQQRIDIFLMDMSSDATPIILSLYDKQTQLASIFKRNDYIGLYHPGLLTGKERTSSQSDITFEYTNDTVLFLMPEKEAQEAGLAKVNLVSMLGSENSFSDPKKDITERDEEGFMDCSNYLSRIHVKDLSHNMLNVTLLGKVVGLANNNPYIKKDGHGKQRMDRYALRITDTTGTMDITLWEEVGRNSRQIRVGQYVLLDNLVTSNKHRVGNKEVWYVNGSGVCGTNTYNISTLSCLLSSASFRTITPLWHAKESNNDYIQVEGIIVGWELHLDSDEFVLSDEYSQPMKSTAPKVDFLDYSLGDRITTIAHSNCLLPSDKPDCEFCGCPMDNDKVYIFRPQTTAKSKKEWQAWIEWRLDDGTSHCKFFGGEETLLDVTAEHFRRLSHQAQIRLLNSVIGLTIICSLSGNSTSTYRLDQVTLLEPTQQECRDMLEAIGKK